MVTWTGADTMNSLEVVALLDEELPAELHLRVGNEFSILVELPDGSAVEGSGQDFFEALCEVRRTLELGGRRLLCAGARRNVYPSAMQRQWTQGRRAYVLGGVPKGEKPPVVDIFWPAGAEDVVSVEEQHVWYIRWLRPLAARSSNSVLTPRHPSDE